METIKPVKRPKVIILYNNKDITQNISKYIESLTYTDYEKGQSDELSITLNDNDGFFQNDWRPVKGDKISAQIGYDGEQLLNCGVFTIDEPELNISTDGDTFVIRALAASINQKLREKSHKDYVNKTLVEIARQIAQKHGYIVAGTAGFIKIPYEIQYNESDLAFLQRLASSYGYIFKLTDTVITLTPVEKLENSKTIIKITRKDIKHCSLRDSATKTYTACKAQYLNPKTGKLVSYTAKTNKSGVKNETYTLPAKYATKEQAKAAATAGLKRGTKTVTGNIEFKSGQINAIAGVNVEVDLNNSYSGVFHVTQSVHTVTKEDYETSIEVDSLK